MLLHSNIGDIQFHFATPLVQRLWPLAERHREGLRNEIMRRSQGETGNKISNLGGWQSKDDLMEWGGEHVAALANWFASCVFYIYDGYHGGQLKNMLDESKTELKLTMKAWANVNGRGDANSMHNHAGCHWSGVYYLDAPPECGRLVALDPRLSVNMMTTGSPITDVFATDSWPIEPENGLTVLFPSWMYHSVEPNRSDQARISIAFNVVVRALQKNQD